MTKESMKEEWICILRSHLVSTSTSQRKFSSRIGVKFGTVANYLAGKVHPLDIKLRISKAIASELGMTLDQYFDFLEHGEIQCDDTDANKFIFWLKNHATIDDRCKIIAISSEAIRDSNERIKEMIVGN